MGIPLQQSFRSEINFKLTHHNPRIRHTEAERIPRWKRINWCPSHGRDPTSPERKAWLRRGHLLPSSPLPLYLPPYPPPVRCSDETESCYVTASGDRFPVWLFFCLSISLSVLFVRTAPWGPQLRTELSCCEACWEDFGAPIAVAFRVFSMDKKKTNKKKKGWQKKILVVYKLISFSWFCFHSESGKAACADRGLICLYALAKPYNMTKPTSRMEDGRWNMHCTVLYWNILHEASILTIKVETLVLFSLHSGERWATQS